MVNRFIGSTINFGHQDGTIRLLNSSTPRVSSKVHAETSAANPSNKTGNTRGIITIRL